MKKLIIISLISILSLTGCGNTNPDFGNNPDEIYEITYRPIDNEKHQVMDGLTGGPELHDFTNGTDYCPLCGYIAEDVGEGNINGYPYTLAYNQNNEETHYILEGTTGGQDVHHFENGVCIECGYIAGYNYNYTQRTGQYGINSSDPDLYNYYYADFMVEKTRKNDDSYVGRYYVDFYYNISDGVKSGNIYIANFCYETEELFWSDEIDIDLENLDNDNILAEIVDCNDEEEMFNLIDKFYMENYDLRQSSDFTIDKLNEMFTEESIKNAQVNAICVD